MHRAVAIWYYLILDALTRSYNESRHLIGRTNCLTQTVSPFDRVQHYHALPLDIECRQSRLLIPILGCFWFQIFWRLSTLKILPYQSLWSYGHGALQARVLYFTTTSLVLYLNTISAERWRHGHKYGMAKPRRRRRRGECRRHENGGAVGADRLPAD